MDVRSMLRSLPSLSGEVRPFDPATAPAAPQDLFLAWLRDAVQAGYPDAQAAVVSTVAEDGTADARVLALKDLTDDGWMFASGEESAKGPQLAAHPTAAMTFFWPGLVRQVRLRGPVERLSAERRALDFRERGVAARAVALTGAQSRVLDDVDAHESAVRAARARLDAEPDLVVPAWTAWALRPERIEFWQGTPSRDHIRLEYRRVDGGWDRVRLTP